MTGEVEIGGGGSSAFLSSGRMEASSTPHASSVGYDSPRKSTKHRHDEVDVNKKQAREGKGQCPSCGQQLYRLEPVDEVCCLMRCFGKVVVHESDAGGQQLMQKVPLTIPRLVERGQCLNCLNGSRSSTDSSSLGSNKTVSTLEDNPDTMFPHPLATLPSMMNESMNRGDPEHAPVPTVVSPAKDSNHHDSGLHLSFSGHLKPPPFNAKPPPPSSRPSPASIPAGTAVYEGEYNAYGEKHGYGEMTWSNGDHYRGNFVNDVRQGHGTLTFAPTTPGQTDGGEYVGDWQNNQMHGSGTRRYPNGDVYMGIYQDGKRHGEEGRFYYANGDLHWGSWQNNHMHGPGRYYYASGQRFEGKFHYSKRSGTGKLQRTDGTLEIFQYVNDQRVGKGVRWSRDRTKAWRLWMPSNGGRTGQAGCGGTVLEKRSISIAEAVGLVSEIELAAATYEEDMMNLQRTMN